MDISVVAAVTRAIARTKFVLFTTFDASKWLLLAICAFLSQCDAGGGTGFNFGNFTSNIPGPPGPPGPPAPPGPPPGTQPGPQLPALPSLPGIVLPGQVQVTLDGEQGDQAESSAGMQTQTVVVTTSPAPGPRTTRNLAKAWIDWIIANASMVIAFAAIGLALGLAFTALLSWISCRGRFMFIDGIVHNRGAVLEPWSAFKQLGNSLFGWSLALNVLGFMTTIIIIGGAILIAMPDIRNDRFGSSAIVAAIVGGTMLIASSLAFALVRMILHDFVVPAMYLHNLRVIPAWQMVRQEIISGYVGEVVLFYLMGIVIAVASVAITTGISCLTCCVTTIPLVGTIILLPLLVFRRCYGLCFIDQFGPRWTVFFDPSQRCQKCGYDLRYSTHSPACPECGEPRMDWTAPHGMAPPTMPQ